MCFAESVARLLVGSSMIATSVSKESTLAIFIRCLSPPDRFVPAIEMILLSLENNGRVSFNPVIVETGVYISDRLSCLSYLKEIFE
jgi:hypothetical protein